ncbi:MAG: permease-like cell division protein FtsX [Pseudomonadales bacterium]|nr:permease-like cell division protein FtsX [Pseudomonadales bacterium]
MIGDPSKKNKQGATWTSRVDPQLKVGAKQESASTVPRGASRQKVTLREQFDLYLERNSAQLLDSLRRLKDTPVATSMTIAVIAIALALPAGLYVMLKNVQSLSDGWSGNSQISLFLESTVSKAEGQKLSATLGKDERIDRVEFISREQALEEFVALSGFSGILSELDENPLPAVIVVFPTASLVTEVELLRVSLQNNNSVELAQLDAEWVQRLHSIVALAERLVLALALGLSLAVLLVMTNTIRLAIESRKDEIIIVKLVGGTDSFVRRPFLYAGAWYGVGGGVLAIIVVQSVLFWLRDPVSDLSSLYGDSFVFLGLDAFSVVFIIFFSAMIGLLGAWLAVGQHLSQVEPE